MADITKCNNDKCDWKLRCYRFVAIPSEFRQSYFAGDVRNEDGSCDYFTEVRRDAA